MRRKWKVGIIFLIGFLLCSLPLVNNYMESKQQESAISTYQSAVKHSKKNNLKTIYKNAKKYNDLLYQTQGSAIANDEILSDENYNKSLDVSGTGIMGSLEIPKINVDLPINHGTSDEALSNGVGHIQGTSLPVGGNNTHAVLSGHRGLPSSKLLVRLDEMKKGDYFFIRTCNKTLAYKVYKIKVVEPTDMIGKKERSMFHLDFFKRKRKYSTKEKEQIAKMLHTTPEALKAFEEAYYKEMLNEKVSDNLFDVNAKQAAHLNAHITVDESEVKELVDRIVAELLQDTPYYVYKNGKATTGSFHVSAPWKAVSKEEILRLPEELRPQLTGSMMVRDISDEVYGMLLGIYADYLKERNPKKKKELYGMFRQGLELQDLDEVMYRMIDKNVNSIGNWFPQLVNAVSEHSFFKLPDTTIIKVPLTLLQLARMDYFSMTKTTLEIVDRFCQKAFQLDPEKEYFIKTGVFSSKYDFRNAHVVGPEEVKTLGEYLLFIHHQSTCFTHYDLTGRHQPTMYGAATTVEWVVRDFIKDTEQNPTIYKGLPLHTEYRVFIDADIDQVIGISPYWRSDVMKQRFGHEEDKDSPHQIHDYIIYSAHEKTLMERYEENKDIILEKVREMLPDLALEGQWSMDIMQNGNDFYIIDMALAQNSALNDCLPKGVLHIVEENWIPEVN